MMGVLAFALHRGSRSAALLLVVDQIANILTATLEGIGLHWVGFLIGGAVLAIFVWAAVGTFVLQRARHREIPDYLPPLWPLLVWAPIAVVIVVLDGFAILDSSGVIAPVELVNGAELNRHQIQSLHEAGLLDLDETVGLFCSDDLFSIVNNGTLLTDRRIVSYYTDADVRRVDEAEFYDVASIARLPATEPDEVSSILLTTFTGDQIFVVLPVSDDMTGFLEQLTIECEVETEVRGGRSTLLETRSIADLRKGFAIIRHIMEEVLGYQPEIVYLADRFCLQDAAENGDIATHQAAIERAFGIDVSSVESGNLVEISMYIVERQDSGAEAPGRP
jgi:hypothetical protein